jgi:Ribonuclease G/E
LVFLARVRGIYATALAALLLKHGFVLSDLSKVLRSRLDVPVADRPPHVTIKQSDDSLDEILVLGYPWEAGERAEKAILAEVGEASVVRGKLGLHTVVDAVSLGGCRARGPMGVELEIESQGDCPQEGVAFRGTIVKEALAAGEKPRVKPGVELVGLTVRVSVPGSGVSFSRFLRDEARASILAALEGRVDVGRAHVRLRSGASLADPGEVAEEALRLYSEALRLYQESPAPEPRIVARGEYISIVALPKTAKMVMDSLRRSLYPTVNRHHEIKSWGGEVESAIVDYAEEGVKRGAWGPEAGDIAAEFIAMKLQEASKVYIRHVTPDRRRISLGPFTVTSVSKSSSPGEVQVILERVFRSHGTLDALGVEKRPGDRGVTRVDSSKWYVIHEYYSQSGELLGVYVNINTPPEVGSKEIKYLDLYVDVVMRPGEEPEIVDMEELERAYAEGLITERLYRKAREEAEKTVGRLKSMFQ